MNCKPGDLAVVIRSRTASNIGKIVRVLRPYSPADAGIFTLDTASMIWLCHTKGSPLEWSAALYIGVHQSESGPIPDECLRPIGRDCVAQLTDSNLRIDLDTVVYAQQTECCDAN